MGHKHKPVSRLVGLANAVIVGPTIALGTSGLVYGQTDNTAILEEVLVTARLRTESAQDIGQSIRAFGAQEMERAGIVDFGDIARRTAGMDFTTRGPNANEVSMRGVGKLVNGGTLDLLSAQPLVSQFLDEIPITAASSRQRDFHSFDLSRVEVLKGPQPTYFGEGSVGGTVRYFSTDPSLEAGVRGKLNANLSTTEGGGDNYTVSGAVEITAIPDVLGFRLMAYQRDDDGFIDNLLTGEDDYNHYESQGGRLSMLAQPTDRLRIRAVAHVSDDEHGGDWIADEAESDPVFSQRPVDEDWEDDFELYSLTLDYDFGPVTLTSVTGYYKRELSYGRYDFVQSLNSIPVLFGIDGDVITQTTSRDENFTQELRLVSNLEGPVNFLAGLYYKDGDTYGTSLAVSPQILELNAAGNALLGIPTPPTGLLFGSDVEGDPVNREQLAVFGELTWAVTEKIRVIAGARWVDEDLSSPVSDPATDNDPALGVCFLTEGFLPPPAIYGVAPCTHSTTIDNATLLASVGLADLREVENSVDGEILPKFALEYDLGDDALVYGSASKAIRNGGLNSTFVVAQAVEVPITEVGYDQDEMWAYEIGIKSAMLEGDIILNGAVFYNDWDDIQALVSTSAGSLIQNAGKATSYGLELEALWQINEIFSLSGGFNYTRSEFDGEQNWETEESAAISELLGREPNIIEDGNSLPNVPEYSVSLAADMVYPTGWQGLDLVGHLDYQWIDERYQSATNSEDSKLPDYALSNLRMGIQSSQWNATLYVSNLTNEISEQAILVAGPGGSTRAAYLNRPRTYGLSLTYEF